MSSFLWHKDTKHPSKRSEYVSLVWIPFTARGTLSYSEPLKQTGRSLSTVLWTKVKATSSSTIHFRESIPLVGFDPLSNSLPLILSCLPRLGKEEVVCVRQRVQLRSKVHCESLKTTSHPPQQPSAPKDNHRSREQNGTEPTKGDKRDMCKWIWTLI